MSQLSAEKLQQLLGQASAMVKHAASEIERRDRVIAEYAKREHAAKIASDMREKNIVPAWALSEDEAINHIMGLDAEKLSAVQMAVDMAAPQDPFAHLDSGSDAIGTEGRIKGASAFEQFVMGGI